MNRKTAKPNTIFLKSFTVSNGLFALNTKTVPVLSENPRLRLELTKIRRSTQVYASS